MTLLIPIASALAEPEMIPEVDADLVGRTAPDIKGPLMKGGAFDLSQQRGKAVLVSFWASWCGPCKAELPALNTFQNEHPELSIVTVNVDRDEAPARMFLNKLTGDFDLPVVWDHKALAMGQYHVASMPTMVLVDANGTVKFQKVGYSEQNGFKELLPELDNLR